MSPATKGVVVILAGLGLTVALGSLSVWILYGAELLRPLSAGGAFGWTVRQVSVPFAVASGSFVVAMICGGVLQDRLGPRWPSTVGGVLVGLGMILASMLGNELTATGPASLPLVLGLGLMVGFGAGLTLSSTVPPAVKWSVPSRHGLVVGLVVSGLALGPLWLNETIRVTIRVHGVGWMLLLHGIVLLATVVLLSLLLENPLQGYVPPGSYAGADVAALNPVPWAGLTTQRMLRTPNFRSFWASSFLLSATSALLVLLLIIQWVPNLANGSGLGAAVALGGAAGALLAGVRHDRSGPMGPWPVVAILVAGLAGGALLAAIGQATAAAFLTAGSCAGGFVVEWACTMDCFGTKSAGANFGLVFTGGAAGSLLGALAAVFVAGGSHASEGVSALMIGGAAVFLLGLGMAVAFAARVRPPATLYLLDDGRGSRRSGTKG